MVTIEQMLKEAIARDASDIFLVAGHPYAFKIRKFISMRCRIPMRIFSKKRMMIFPFPYRMSGGFAAMSICREIRRQRFCALSALNFPILLN